MKSKVQRYSVCNYVKNMSICIHNTVWFLSTGCSLGHDPIWLTCRQIYGAFSWSMTDVRRSNPLWAVSLSEVSLGFFITAFSFKLLIKNAYSVSWSYPSPHHFYSPSDLEFFKRSNWINHGEQISKVFLYCLCFSSCFQVPVLRACLGFSQR